ncbi:MAG: hypothetical protein OHK93_003696 [Ramalina farinacea]|uniref:Uncharacterized protein n=1 Tax=Ramalina farinacea TaxID=258253 RepID=A0AA43U1H3_9LECA|nr:hypothetical protein [Ramalina farinacea]
MANGCPLLRRFDMKVQICDSGPELTGDQFSRLLRALPQVELLSLSVRFRMTASKLRDLANCCSRLEILKMDQTRLFLSLESLMETPSLSGLRELRLRSVWIKNPGRYTQLRRLQSIATAWSRVFPRIQRSPCPSDLYVLELHVEEDSSSGESNSDDGNLSSENDSEVSLDDPEISLDFAQYVSEHTLRRESDDDVGDWSTDNVSDVSLDDPGLDLDFDEFDSDWYRLRRRLWKLLGYEMEVMTEILTGINHMWQSNFEIETFDWPITPMSAFLDPQTHSTAEATEVLNLTPV